MSDQDVEKTTRDRAERHPDDEEVGWTDVQMVRALGWDGGSDE